MNIKNLFQISILLAAFINVNAVKVDVKKSTEEELTHFNSLNLSDVSETKKEIKTESVEAKKSPLVELNLEEKPVEKQAQVDKPKAIEVEKKPEIVLNKPPVEEVVIKKESVFLDKKTPTIDARKEEIDRIIKAKDLENEKKKLEIKKAEAEKEQKKAQAKTAETKNFNAIEYSENKILEKPKLQDTAVEHIKINQPEVVLQTEKPELTAQEQVKTKSGKTIEQIKKTKDYIAKERQKEIQAKLQQEVKKIGESQVIIDYSVSEKQKKWLRTDVEKHKILERKRFTTYTPPPNLVQKINTEDNAHLPDQLFEHELIGYIITQMKTGGDDKIGEIKAIFEKIIDKNATDKFGNNLVMHAVNTGNIRLLKYFLKSGCSPNVKNRRGISPLHLAIFLKDKKITLELLKNNANPNLKDNSGNTPLFYSAASKQVGIFKTLLSFGADKKIKNKEGVDVSFVIKINKLEELYD